METIGSRRAHLEKSDYDKDPPGSRRPQTAGRPPHPPHSKNPYPRQYAGYPGSTRPPQQLQSVVTSSFSGTEDERDASQRGYPPVPRHVNVSINPAESQLWRSPLSDERYPRDGFEANARAMDQEGRQPPPTGEEPPTIVPPSPARGGPNPRNYTMGRSSSNEASYMGPPEPMKRSFWHHSRPNDEFIASALPPEFVPPKRAKMSPRGEPKPAKSPTHASELRDLQRPPSFFSRASSWESRSDEPPYYRSFPIPHSRPSPRQSPRCAPDQGRSFHHCMEGSPRDYPRSSPPSHYEEDEYYRGPPSLYSPHFPYTSNQDMPYPLHRHPPSHAAAVAATAASQHHHRGRWGNCETWVQNPAPSPTAGPRRSPTYYQHPPNMGPANQFRDDVETGREWPHTQGNAEFDDSPYRLDHQYSRVMPPSNNHQFLQLPPFEHNVRRGPMNAITRHSMDEDSHISVKGHPHEIAVRNTQHSGTSKDDSPLLLLALPQDRISLSETLCVVREVRCDCSEFIQRYRR